MNSKNMSWSVRRHCKCGDLLLFCEYSFVIILDKRLNMTRTELPTILPSMLGPTSILTLKCLENQDDAWYIARLLHTHKKKEPWSQEKKFGSSLNVQYCKRLLLFCFSELLCLEAHNSNSLRHCKEMDATFVRREKRCDPADFRSEIFPQILSIL